MRGRRRGWFIALWLAVAVAGACNQPSPPTEDVSSSTGPPITVCYEPDGALCPPLDAGEDAPSEAGSSASDAAPGSG